MKTHVFFIAILLSITVSMSSFAQSLSITSGLNWLSVTQNMDGSWGTNASATIVDTTEVISAKMKFDYDASIQNASTWLTAQEVDTVDELSRKVRSLSYVGTDTSFSISALINAINSENGWGYNAGYSSTPLETSLALQALKTANYSDLTIINPALAYLTGSQNADGGWGFAEGDDSKVYITAMVSSTIQQFPQTTTLSSSLYKATNYLLSHQNIDGGFGSPMSEVHETALAYTALVAVITDATVLGKAVSYLTTSQSADGSWLQDPYSTALALRALHFSEYKPAPPPPLPTTGTLTGKVIDSATGGDLASVAVSLFGNPALKTQTDASGVFKLADVPQGSQQITLALTSYTAATATVTVTAGAIVNLGSLPLSASSTTGVVQGRVTDATTLSPLEGVVISVTGGGSWTAVTAADGSFAISDITPGAVTLSAVKAGYPAVIGIGTVTAGGTLVFSPALLASISTGEVRGSVVADGSGLPIVGATVTLTGAQSSYTTTSTGDGRYFIANVEPDGYLITFTASGYYGRSGAYLPSVTAGSVTELGATRLKPAPAATRIHGKVIDGATGTPIPGAVVSVTGTEFVTKTDSSGAYTISGINLLEFEVQASATGYDTLAYPLISPYHDVLSVDFSLNSTGIMSFSTDKESYQAYADVAITAGILNTGTIPVTASIRVSILNALNEVVADLQATAPDADGVEGSHIVLQPGLPRTINFTWGTGCYPPGVYEIIVKVIADSPGSGLEAMVVAQRSLNISIEPTQALASLVLSPLPRFTNLGATEQISLQASIVNRSNIPTEVEYSYQWNSPAGVVLHTGSGIVSAQPVEISKAVLVESFPYTLTESGDHPLQVRMISGPTPASVIGETVSVAPRIRIEPTQNLTPQTVIPDGNKRLRFNIRLKGVESK